MLDLPKGATKFTHLSSFNDQTSLFKSVKLKPSLT